MKKVLTFEKQGSILISDKRNTNQTKNKIKKYGGNKMFKKIEAIVTEKEVKELDRVVKNIYNVGYANNYSTAYNLGFDTVANLNGSGYKNLVRIVDNLNYGGEDEYFARFILEKVLNNEQIEILKKELSENRNRYVRFLYL